MVKEYIKLLRVKHYIKNLLVFVPLFFGQEFFIYKKLENAFYGMVSFCFVSSSIYIINDIKDKEKDKNHPTKQNRPIANGKIKVKQAVIVCVGCLCLSGMLALKTKGIFFLICYFFLNLLYTFGMKNRPIIDVFILASGFVIRIFYGAFLTETPISAWEK